MRLFIHILRQFLILYYFLRAEMVKIFCVYARLAVYYPSMVTFFVLPNVAKAPADWVEFHLLMASCNCSRTTAPSLLPPITSHQFIAFHRSSASTLIAPCPLLPYLGLLHTQRASSSHSACSR
ncbi:hypothetical protein Acife_3181 [Acidithiobacillus ferrivorans SS3]|uniref:Uncharacterized protein n=1 Tax=Acidithiobacillus ferrivorans SS3 TaxID=743299 RepID=G0JLT1_9PROT|nr:hypothetical protein Acife_3181 [Acidithiobacillus ferrivorans SS3]